MVIGNCRVLSSCTINRLHILCYFFNLSRYAIRTYIINVRKLSHSGACTYYVDRITYGQIVRIEMYAPFGSGEGNHARL